MFVQTLFIQTAPNQVVNTAAELSAIGSGKGSLLLPPNFWMEGRAVRFQMQGSYETPLIAPTLVARLKVGNVTIATLTTSALISTDGHWLLEGTITCRTHGANSELVVYGHARYQSLLLSTFEAITGSGSVVTDAEAMLDITAQWDAASNSRSLVTNVAWFEFLT